jgi:hypothetical protein
MYEEPARPDPKIVKATRKVGSVSPGLPNIPKGHLYYYGYQKAAGTRKNSGPSGKRSARWYAGRFKSGAVKKSTRA